MGEQVGAAARKAIREAHEAFLSRARRSIAGHRDGELHATRIAGKRLRYTVEFFASALGEPRVTALGLLALLQDRLGTIADAEAFERFYEDLAKAMPEGDHRRTGLQARRAACEQQRREGIEAVRTLWRGGTYPPYPDMLGAAISAALSSPGSDPA
jgi:CHAD domain-containing protein